MKLDQIKKGKMSKYSFRDLEYAVKLLYKEIEELHIAMKVVRRMESDKGRSKHEIDDYVMTPFNSKEQEIMDTIKKVETELAERLLTGNDDGALERELLGDKYV